MTQRSAVTVARGDGIGPEIMAATLFVLEEAGALLDIEEVQIGEKLYLTGHPTGIEAAAFESLRRTKVFLKAPITTPQGGGFRSLNVTIRTAFGLYANVRPCIAYHPFVPTKHPAMDLVIIRENEEDLYTGIEYQQTPDACHAIKLISRPGSEKIIRYAFEYARRYGRKTVTCLTKDNILKISDGLFHKIFDAIGEEYPEFEKKHWIVDIGMAKVADTPEHFDLIVLPNLYGDILSDITAQISGSIGLVGTANMGEHGAMFEAIHGSAPALANRDVANPSGLILAAVLMLVHLGQSQVAQQLHNAWLATLEEGIHTKDIYREGVSHLKVGTQAFAQAIAKNLGKEPHTLKPVRYAPTKHPWIHHGTSIATAQRHLHGIDVYLYSHKSLPQLVEQLHNLPLPLTLITNRGTKMWPEGPIESFCIDTWRCRFESPKPTAFPTFLKLLDALHARGLDITKTEHLYTFDGIPGYSNVERPTP